MIDPEPPEPNSPPHRPLFLEMGLASGGYALLVAGAAFLAAGTLLGSWPLVLWGALMLGLLLVARHLAQEMAEGVARSRIWLELGLPPARSRSPAVVGRPLTLELGLHNELLRDLPVSLGLDTSCALSHAPGQPELIELMLPMGRWSLPWRLLPLRIGRSTVHGARVRLRCGLGLYLASAYWPLEQRISVLWNRSESRGARAARVSRSLQDRTGGHRLRQAGLGTEFKEIREHHPGDPFRIIEWKASARHRRLMVRELESEVVLSLTVLLDISPSMRRGRVGESPLDHCTRTCLGLARAALASQDRFGLITYDQRVFGELPPTSGRAQLGRIAGHLAELFDVVDEDLSAARGVELREHIAKQLLLRRGLRVPALTDPLEDPGRDELQAAMDAQLEGKAPPRQAWLDRSLPSPKEDEARLRLACHGLGIRLPYRVREGPGEGAEGLAAALMRVVARSRGGSMVLVLSDLEWEAGDEVLGRTLKLARSRCLRVVSLHAAPGAFLPRPEEPREALIQDLLAADQLERSQGPQLLRSMGIRMLPWSLARSPERLYSLLQRGTAARQPAHGWASTA